MKKYFILSLLISWMSFAMQTNLVSILDKLADRIYCISEVDGDTNKINQELDKAAQNIKEYIASHKEEINNDRNAFKIAFIGAAGVGNEEIIKIFLEAGCEVDSKNEKGQTAAMYAAMRSNVSTLQALLEAGADVNAVCNDSKSLEDYASLTKKLLIGNDEFAKIALIPTIVTACARYEAKDDSDPFNKCLELIQSKKTSKN